MNEPEPEPPRIGRFFVSEELWADEALAYSILAKCVPTKIEFDWAARRFDITAIGPDFEPVLRGFQYRHYGLNLTEVDVDGLVYTVFDGFNRECGGDMVRRRKAGELP